VITSEVGPRPLIYSNLRGYALSSLKEARLRKLLPILMNWGFLDEDRDFRGKGRLWKTWLATNLACTLLTKGLEVSFLDADVEEPNAHLFLKPKIERTERVNVLVPQVDGSLCDGCGECHRFCAFNAILPLGLETLVFHELCHGCGGCAMVCPKNAIKEVPLAIGTISEGRKDGLTFAMGTLDIGYPRPGPVIEAVQKKAKARSLTIIDTPRGHPAQSSRRFQGSRSSWQSSRRRLLGLAIFAWRSRC